MTTGFSTLSDSVECGICAKPLNANFLKNSSGHVRIQVLTCSVCEMRTIREELGGRRPEFAAQFMAALLSDPGTAGTPVATLAQMALTAADALIVALADPAAEPQTFNGWDRATEKEKPPGAR